ncbi:MAG: NAD-dependent epimerase/dehydratase family protein [Methylophilaceae bacterium]|nr:NAD-dependent epimerase/dehydratase family protein [Methylophilaceae bacterium]
MRDGIFLTGAAGFLGQALTRQLLAEGRTLHRLLRQPEPPRGPTDHVHVGTVEGIGQFHSILTSCHTLVHLAAATTPASSTLQPIRELDANLRPLLMLIEVLQSHPHLHVVFISSGGALYGNIDAQTADERTPLAPLSYHGAGKVAGEAFLHALHHQVGLRVTILRPANLYGPRQPLHTGFGLIRTLLEHARQGCPLQVWGDGENVRDFLYIDDMVAACVCALAPVTCGWRAYNVGTGIGYSLNQVRALVETITGRPVLTEYHPARPGDVRRIVLDSRAAQRELGWQARVSLEDGIRRTWQWLTTRPA